MNPNEIDFLSYNPCYVFASLSNQAKKDNINIHSACLQSHPNFIAITNFTWFTFDVLFIQHMYVTLV